MQKLLLISICLFISACAGQSGQERANNFDAAEAAKTRISLGLTYLKNGNFSQAKRNLDKALCTENGRSTVWPTIFSV